MFPSPLPVFLKFEKPELVLQTVEIESIRPAKEDDWLFPGATVEGSTVVTVKSGREYAVAFTLDQWTEALS